MTQELARHIMVSTSWEFRLGVTGHRSLENHELLKRQVEDTLCNIDHALVAAASGAPRAYVVISALAPGADQLIAEAVLERVNPRGLPAPYLRAVLPMQENEYVGSFGSGPATERFRRLLSRAKETIRLADEGPEPYERLAAYLIESCHLLIAIWDHQPSRGPGGTAEAIAAAQKSGRPVFIIHSETGVITRPSASQLASAVMKWSARPHT